MGYKLGIEIANSNLSLHDKLSWHLSANHYPPVGDEFIPIAMQAIEFAATGEWDTVLQYPNDRERTVAYTIEGLHLEPFVSDMSVPNDKED